jgi:hypothetical protein
MPRSSRLRAPTRSPGARSTSPAASAATAREIVAVGQCLHPQNPGVREVERELAGR